MKKKFVTKLILVILIVLLIITQTGCFRKTDPTPLWDEGYYLDTVCRITLYATDDELKMSVAKPILSDAFDMIRRYEALLSRTKEGSDIWRINHAEGKTVVCDSETVQLLSRALRYSDLSGGAFDITIGTVSDLWDFHGVGDTATIPTSAELSRAIRHVDYGNVMVEGNTVTLTDPAAQIDLGGIAKGYIADRVSEYLRTRGVTGAVVDLGGNIEIVGYKRGWVPLESEKEDAEIAETVLTEDHDNGVAFEDTTTIAGGAPFVIGIKKPYTESNEIVATLAVSDCSVVTSGVYERYIEVNGKQYHHILSSTTGYPVNSDLVSVTIVGPEGNSADCDAIATTCLILGKKRAVEFVENRKGYNAIMIDDAGEITTVGTIPDFKIIEDGNEDAELTEEGIKID